MSAGENSSLPVAGTSGGRWPSAIRRPLRALTGLLVVIGVAVAVAGVGEDISAAARAGGPVPVLVHVRVLKADRLRTVRAVGRNSETLLPFQASKPYGSPLSLALYLEANQESWLDLGTGPFVFNALGSTVAEQALAHGGTAVFGICLWWGALLARRLLLSIGGGQPFQRQNAARIAGIAGLIVVVAIARDLLPYLATLLVLRRLGLSGAASPLAAQLAIAAMPLVLALGLLVLALAFRRGTQLVSDSDGLV